MDKMGISHFKNKIAHEKGYANWQEYYNWIARDGQLPCVVAQLVESAMEDASKAMIVEIKNAINEIIVYN